MGNPTATNRYTDLKFIPEHILAALYGTVSGITRDGWNDAFPEVTEFSLHQSQSPQNILQAAAITALTYAEDWSKKPTAELFSLEPAQAERKQIYKLLLFMAVTLPYATPEIQAKMVRFALDFCHHPSFDSDVMDGISIDENQFKHSQRLKTPTTKVSRGFYVLAAAAYSSPELSAATRKELFEKLVTPALIPYLDSQKLHQDNPHYYIHAEFYPSLPFLLMRPQLEHEPLIIKALDLCMRDPERANTVIFPSVGVFGPRALDIVATRIIDDFARQISANAAFEDDPRSKQEKIKPSEGHPSINMNPVIDLLEHFHRFSEKEQVNDAYERLSQLFLQLRPTQINSYLFCKFQGGFHPSGNGAVIVANKLPKHHQLKFLENCMIALPALPINEYLQPVIRYMQNLCRTI